MLEKLNALVASLQSLFDEVAIADDTVLQKSNTATVFVEKVNVSYLTSTRKRLQGRVGVIWNVPGAGNEVFSAADTKLEQMLSFAEIEEVQFSYVENLRKLFVYTRILLEWEV